MRQVRNFGILALIALALVVLPGGGPTVNVVLTLLGAAFLVALGFFLLQLYHENRWTLESMELVYRVVLYSSIGLAFLTFAGYQKLWQAGGASGRVVWLALLALAGYGVFWSWAQARRLS
ncbi:MAG TPA: hypothetical protein VGF74_14805 [Thermoleophilaceae bacterium]